MAAGIKAWDEEPYTGSKLKAWIDAMIAVRKTLGITGVVAVGRRAVHRWQ